MENDDFLKEMNIRAKEGFKVPENYFEENKRKLLSIPDENASKVIPLWQKILPITAIAAAFVISVILFQPDEATDPVANIPDTEIEEYLYAEYGFDIEKEVIENDNILSELEETDPIEDWDDEDIDEILNEEIENSVLNIYL